MTITFLLISYIFIEMNEEDQQMLLSRMLSILPKHDGVSYLQRLEEFEWDNARFGDFSVKSCQEQFKRILAKVRFHFVTCLLECVCASAWKS